MSEGKEAHPPTTPSVKAISTIMLDHCRHGKTACKVQVPLHACSAQSAAKWEGGVPTPANPHHLASNTTTGRGREEMGQAHM